MRFVPDLSETQSCVECDKTMILVATGKSLLADPPQYELWWECFGCGRREYESAPVFRPRPHPTESDYKRWCRVNKDTQ